MARSLSQPDRKWLEENRSYNADSSNSSISNFKWSNFDNFLTNILLFVPTHIIEPFIISTNKTSNYFPLSENSTV